jgi:hypothetical protein
MNAPPSRHGELRIHYSVGSSRRQDSEIGVGFLDINRERIPAIGKSGGELVCRSYLTANSTGGAVRSLRVRRAKSRPKVSTRIYSASRAWRGITTCHMLEIFDVSMGAFQIVQR